MAVRGHVGILRQRYFKQVGWLYDTNYDDIVTHLPPQILGYKHVGEVVDLTPKGHYKQAKRWYDRNVLPHMEGEILKGLEETGINALNPNGAPSRFSPDNCKKL